MKKFLLSAAATIGFFASMAQLPEDVLRYSYFPQHGSARNMAIGGAMGSLGGDINALYVNPAGLGLYKTRELVLSPGFLFNNNKANFRGTDTKSNKSAFDLGTSGIVIGFNSRNSKWTNQAFSFGISQTANFNNFVSYKGSNNLSSYTEQFTEELRNSGLSLDEALNNPGFAYGTAPAIYTYLIDTFPNGNGGYNIKGLPEFLLEKNISLDQQKTIDTKGGIYELALGYAANMDDRLYLGGSLGIPIVNYSRFTKYRESDPSGDPNNNFDYFEYNDYLTTKGFGVNGKLGLIFKPQEYIRLGLAVHTPTFYTLTDRQTTDLTSATENYTSQPVRKVSSTQFTDGEQGKTLYTATTPWKAIFSGSYVIREVNDIRRQRGFITADIEYVGYPGSNFKADGQNVTSADQQYYEDLKGIIKESYKSAFNYRLGGELKFNTVMFRLGGAYYSNPYKDKSLNSHLAQVSGGIGYRNHGMFIDLTYIHNLNKDVNFPYRLTDKPNTYAMQQNTRGNVVMTVGFKL
ncbi:OmpP1/FadL family transporter [Segetibacter koreensis]|uniref:OmpP1/FadL family transporter n=1 Tax=Segetibacter koreensis TaxID=398037 RepID=UPI00036EC8FB|nr:hypothetical protein [Segetibacter koreensis]